MRRNKQAGFAILEFVLVIVVLAAIVFAGLWVYSKRNNSATTASSGTSQSAVAHDVSTAPAINSASDLDKALTILNQNDPSSADTADSSQLSSQANF